MHGVHAWGQVSKKDWMESVKLVFDYFCERTPRSFVELRETSVVWNYKYADVEFGRLQARDLLQHLWTGPISNAPVDIVQVFPPPVIKGDREPEIITPSCSTTLPCMYTLYTYLKFQGFTGTMMQGLHLYFAPPTKCRRPHFSKHLKAIDCLQMPARHDDVLRLGFNCCGE